MNLKLFDADSRIRDTLHRVFAELFDEIEKATGGEIIVEDLTINSYAVDVSVTMKPREEPAEGRVEEAEK